MRSNLKKCQRFPDWIETLKIVSFSTYGGSIFSKCWLFVADFGESNCATYTAGYSRCRFVIRASCSYSPHSRVKTFGMIPPPSNSPHIFVDNIPPRLNLNLIYFQSVHDAPFVHVTDRPQMPTLDGKHIINRLVGK